jgi:glucose/mannose-6-phosphate isomerase
MSDLTREPEDLLDDATALAAGDPEDMLRAVATSGAQVRSALRAHQEAAEDIARVVADGRPRSVVVAGMGGSGVSGDVLAAILGPGCPVPVVTVRDYVLPGWVGSLDLVLAVSCSGGTEETLDLVDEGVRRGVRLVGVGAAGSPLAERTLAAGGVFLPVDAAGRQPRASMWSLAVPLLLLADALGLGSVPVDVVERVADRLDQDAERYGPASDLDGNRAKALALELHGSLPMVWGTGVIGGVAAYRFACQLNENAKLPAVHGALPEANHNQVVAFDGRFGAAAPAGADVDDLFRDRVEDPEPPVRLRLVLLRDEDEHPQVRLRAETSLLLAQDRGVLVSQLRSGEGHPLERLAALVALGDFATVYLALLDGLDPTPVAPITALKRAIAR